MEEEQRRVARNAQIDQEIEALKSALEEKGKPVNQRILDQKLAELPAELRGDLQAALATPAEKRTEVQKYLLDKFGGALRVEPEELKKADAAYQAAAEETRRQMRILEAQKIPPPEIAALYDRGNPSPTYVLRRGEVANIGPWVGPGIPAVLTDGKAAFAAEPPWPGANKTGRRLALARWLVRPDNPLTARVMVNRMWAHHFGTGIVKTLGNFGRAGTPPTNPELLDWLATEFVRQGWSMKAMQRLMMTSSTYRQRSIVTPELERLDPDNVLLSRMPLKRMEAEVLYDSLLLVSDHLDETRYGPPQPVDVMDDGLVVALWVGTSGRRSIYLEQRRTEIPTMLESFDLPPMGPNCLERPKSTVALQALNLMNDKMVHNLAEFFAERVHKEAGDDPEKQIETAFWIALSRPPQPEEREVSREAFKRLMAAETRALTAKAGTDPRPASATSPAAAGSQSGNRPALDRQAAQLALAKFCHTLINSAAFINID